MQSLKLVLAATVAANQNPDENTCEAHRSCWAGHELKYPNMETPRCFSDDDCLPGNYCIQTRWDYNGQVSSFEGCWRKNVCAGTGTWLMFEERTLQFWCTDEQLEENKDETEPPFSNLVSIEPARDTPWEPICETDADCPHPE